MYEDADTDESRFNVVCDAANLVSGIRKGVSVREAKAKFQAKKKKKKSESGISFSPKYDSVLDAALIPGMDTVQ